MDFDRLTIKAQSALEASRQIARDFAQQQAQPLHVLQAILQDAEGTAYPLLHEAGVNTADLRSAVDVALHNDKVILPVPDEPLFSPETATMLDMAAAVADTHEDGFVTTDHMLIAMVGQGETGEILHAQRLTPQRIHQAYVSLRAAPAVSTSDKDPEWSHPMLQTYGRDLTALAEKGMLDPCIGREEEQARLIEVLLRRLKNNPVLIGSAGVGKTAIVEGLAQRMADGRVPNGLRGRKLFAIDLGAMVAGATYRGQFEERLKLMMEEIQDAPTDVITFFDELHTLVGAGKTEGGMDAGNLLKPMLARGELRAIGATTMDEYRKHVEKDPALERRFQPIMVDEPTVGETIRILRGLRQRYEAHHSVKIEDQALVAAAKLSDRFVMGRLLPDKAIDLIDESASRLRIERDAGSPELVNLRVRIARYKEDGVEGGDLEKAMVEEAELAEQWDAVLAQDAKLEELTSGLQAARAEADAAEAEGDLKSASEIRFNRIPFLHAKVVKAQEGLDVLQADGVIRRTKVTPNDVAAVVSRWTGVPSTKLLADESAKLLNLEDQLHQRVVGQDEPVKAIADAIRTSRSGLADPNRPIGSFLFLGPTGVGKTELARALAEVLFDDQNAMVRIDMSEYGEKHSVSRLIGSPPGYVGYDDAGQLSEAVRRKPYSVVLLDEMEKAHADVFNILLQVLDDGRLTDGQGRVANFRNTIVVMTSNLGSGVFSDPDVDQAKAKAEVLADVRGHFRPEFVNRVDEIMVFNTLAAPQIRSIVDIQLQDLHRRLDEQGVKLDVADSAKDYLAERGYQPEYGARPLKRLIGREMRNPLARLLLAENVGPGTVVQVAATDQGLAFEAKETV